MKILVTGGAGFIGCNVADYYLTKGDEIIVLDNFSRDGAVKNINWLKGNHKNNLKVVHCDIRLDTGILTELINEADIVFHFAAQVAVTTSVVNPKTDFEINALGTFNVLEAVRLSKSKPVLLFSSTNKVYGKLEDIKIKEREKRYGLNESDEGISEHRLLDFHSPYGCSKGAADQYVRDYARIYNLKTIVFRQSCIYGIRQFGVEDQGWVAHFVIATILDKPVTIYGTGKQVRDILFIDDLVNAYDLALKNIDNTAGNIYNIGGGKENTLSILELVDYLEKKINKKIKYKFTDWRPGDQPVFICDINKANLDFSWKPRIGVNEGIARLINWVSENKNLFI